MALDVARLNIHSGNREEVSAFLEKTWPEHNARAGIDWVVEDHYITAHEGERMVGAAHYRIVGGVGGLDELVVVPDRMHEGIGSRLMVEFETRCRAAGCHLLNLDTGDYQARPFYEKHGWRVYATLSNHRFGHEWYLMEKPLAG